MVQNAVYDSLFIKQLGETSLVIFIISLVVIFAFAGAVYAAGRGPPDWGIVASQLLQIVAVSVFFEVVLTELQMRKRHYNQQVAADRATLA